MRIALATVGILFAAGFLAVDLLYPPPNGKMWPLGLCAGFCLLITIACLGRRAGRIAGRMIGASICALYIGYFIDEVRQGRWLTPRSSGTSALNAAIGFCVFGFPGGSYALTGRLWPFGKDCDGEPFHRMKIEAWLQRERGIGAVLCREAESTEDRDLWRALADLPEEVTGGEFETIDPKQACKVAREILRRDRGTERIVLAIQNASSLAVEFVEAASRGESILEARTLEAENAAVLVVRTKNRTAFLAVIEDAEDPLTARARRAERHRLPSF